jgi:long-chain acyl-CoA synthetase
MLNQAQNLNQAILAAMDSYANRPCFQVKRAGHFEEVTYSQFQQLTFRIARFLQNEGIANGERVALVTDNCLEWMVLYLATLMAGGVAVPLRPTISPDTLRFTLQDSGASVVMLENPDHVQAISNVRDAPENELPDLKSILVKGELDALSFETIPIAAILMESSPLTAKEEKVLRSFATSTAP